jgi:hypothetical protein
MDAITARIACVAAAHLRNLPLNQLFWGKSMVAAALATFSLLAAPSEAIPRHVDAPLTNYYARALTAADGGEPHKALAMLELLLVPAGTEVVADYSNVPAEFRGAFQRGVERGFAMWQQELGADFPFKLVLRPSKESYVKLTFVDSIPDSPALHKGEIRTTRKIQWNRTVHYGQFEAAIDIVQWASGRTLMDESDVAHVTGHEIGHALGLGDAGDTQHIMGPVALGNAFARIAPDEAEAVKAFRKLIRSQIDRLLTRAAK